MPVYEFICRKCGTRFEEIQSLGEHDRTKPTCPQCKTAKSVEQELSPFYAQTPRKS